MVAEPLLVVVYVVESGSQFIVGKAVVRKILDDDALQLLELAGRVAVMFGKDVNIVVVPLLSADECLDVWEESFLLISHVPLYVVGIFII